MTSHENEEYFETVTSPSFIVQYKIQAYFTVTRLFKSRGTSNEVDGTKIKQPTVRIGVGCSCIKRRSVPMGNFEKNT